MDKLRLWYIAQPRAIRRLLLMNVIVYLIWNLAFVHFRVTASFVYSYLALNPTLPEIVFRPWQLVTYSFLHLGIGLGGFLHVLFNMLWLMWIGREYEEFYGAHRLFAVYMLGSIGGALMTVFLHTVFPSIGPFGGIVHGASASVLCLMTVVAIKFPMKSIALMFIGVVRLSYVVIGFLVLDILWSAGGGTSISAHWGGALTGFVFARAFLAGSDLSGWAVPLFGTRSYSGDRSVLHRLEEWVGRRFSAGSSTSISPISDRPETAGRDRWNSSQNANRVATSTIDEILDKIGESGYEALSEEEKQILFQAGGDR